MIPEFLTTLPSYYYVIGGIVALLLVLYYFQYDLGISNTFSSIKGKEETGGCLYYFYQEECPHCIEASPVIDQLESELSKNGKKITVKRVDCNNQGVSEGFLKGYSVQGTPHITFEDPNGRKKVYGYNKPYTVEDLLKFIAD